MSLDSQYGNPKAADTQKLGPQGISTDTFINKSENIVPCNTFIPASNGWGAKKRDIYDKDGNKTGWEYIFPYNAPNLLGEREFNKYSNEFFRKDAEWRRFLPYTDAQVAATNFKDMSLAGTGYLQRATSINQKHCIQSQVLEETFKTFEEIETDYADIQLGWENNGQFSPLDSNSCSFSSCRPVTTGEVAYYYYLHPEIYATDPLLFSNCETMTPKPLPTILGLYPTIYKQHFSRVTLKLFTDPNIYAMLREGLPMAAYGPANEKLILTRYDTVLSEYPNFVPGGENKQTINFLWAFGAAGNPDINNFMASITNPLDAGAVFSCDASKVVGEVNTKDTPPLAALVAYVTGIVRSGIDIPSWSFSYNNPLKVKVPANSTKLTQNVASTIMGFIPVNDATIDQIKLEPNATKVTNLYPPLPGGQGEQAIDLFTKYMHPQAWQDNYNKTL